MKTSEASVKVRIKRILNAMDAYYFMPQAGIYGRAGVPDFIGCIKGKFFAIEAKANGNKPTKLQTIEMEKIEAHKGKTFVIDENNIDTLQKMLTELTDDDS